MPPKPGKDIEQIPQHTVSLLNPQIDELKDMIKECVKNKDFQTIKANLLVTHYKLDSGEQYSGKT